MALDNLVVFMVNSTVRLLSYICSDCTVLESPLKAFSRDLESLEDYVKLFVQTLIL